MNETLIATIVPGNYIDCADELFDDRDSGVITRVWADEAGTTFVTWVTEDGEDREDTLAGLVKTVEDRLAEVVVRPVCGCPDHSNGAVEASECFCSPECARGEARHLDFTSREAMVAWLVENDHNGCHSDEEATEESGEPHTLESALACYRGVMDLE